MLLQHFELQVGDVIDIRYAAGRLDGPGDEPSYRWVSAKIIDCSAGSWPLALLSDGQFTDVRPFMTWRRGASQGFRSLTTLVA